MSRRMVCGVTEKWSASASIDMKPRWRTRSRICCWREFWAMGANLSHSEKKIIARFKTHSADADHSETKNMGRIMAKPRFILAIDQGTTSTRAILFDTNGEPQATAQQELPQIYRAAGWAGRAT